MTHCAIIDRSPLSPGHNRDWNVDLIPKCVMACGKLVKMLLHTKTTRYLKFKSIDASYAFKGGKIFKVRRLVSWCGASHYNCGAPPPPSSQQRDISGRVTAKLLFDSRCPRP